MKSLFSLLSFLILLKGPIEAQSPKLNWIYGIGDTGPDAANAIITDNEGNILCLGFFRGNPDFNPGTERLTLNSNGTEDIFISKWKPNGELIWAKNFGGKREDRGIQMTVDLESNIYIVGYFREQIQFDQNKPESRFFTKGFSDGFILKLNPDGEVLWVRQIGGNLEDIPKSIIVDQEKNLWVTGYFQGVCRFYEDSMHLTELNSKGVNDIFLIKLNSDGNSLKFMQWGGKLDDQSVALMSDQDGNIFLTLNFLDSIDVDPGPGETIVSAKGTGDILILKLDDKGDLIDFGQVQSAGLVNNIGAVMDLNGNVLLTGFFVADTDFDPGVGTYWIKNNTTLGEIFILKLDSNLQYQWAKSMGGEFHDVGLGITTDAGGNVYTTGCFQSEADFDPGPGKVILLSEGSHNNDIFISKLNEDGEFVWARSINGPGNDIGFSMNHTFDGQLLVCGIFNANVGTQFSPDTVYSLRSSGAEDFFMLNCIQNISETNEDSILNLNGIISNLVHDVLIINGIKPVDGLIEVKISDLNGRLIIKTQELSTNSEDQILLDLNQLCSGTYFLEIIARNSKKVQRFIKL